MDNYRIIFPAGYLNTNIFNDNIDVNVIFRTGEVYFGTLVTVENMKSFLDRGDLYFWMTDMFVVKDLRKETIKLAIQQAIAEEDFKCIFDKIGTLDEIIGDKSYDELVDMNDLSTDNL